jgi:hypothetical protein
MRVFVEALFVRAFVAMLHKSCGSFFVVVLVAAIRLPHVNVQALSRLTSLGRYHLGDGTSNADSRQL